MGIETKFVNGLRVTDAPTMEIAKMVLDRQDRAGHRRAHP